MGRGRLSSILVKERSARRHSSGGAAKHPSARGASASWSARVAPYLEAARPACILEQLCDRASQVDSKSEASRRATLPVASCRHSNSTTGGGRVDARETLFRGLPSR
jgi:hypothetical protein